MDTICILMEQQDNAHSMYNSQLRKIAGAVGMVGKICHTQEGTTPPMDDGVDGLATHS